jgi:hypothetical protein
MVGASPPKEAFGKRSYTENFRINCWARGYDEIMNYILYIATALLALLYLAKDWEGHKKSWRRLVVLGLIILIGTGGIFNTYYTNKKIDRQHDNDQKRIAGLKEAVDTANKNQEDNTRQFVNAFGKLSQKVSDLKAKSGLRAFMKKQTN